TRPQASLCDSPIAGHPCHCVGTGRWSRVHQRFIKEGVPMKPAHPHMPDDGATAEDDFFVGIKRPICHEHEEFDIYTSEPSEPRPAVVFVHGGPIPTDEIPTPRHWTVFTGYGALAASAGLVGCTVDHRLHTMEHYPVSAKDVSPAGNQVRQLPQVDPNRIVQWLFAGGGGLAAD